MNAAPHNPAPGDQFRSLRYQRACGRREGPRLRLRRLEFVVACDRFFESRGLDPHDEASFFARSPSRRISHTTDTKDTTKGKAE